MAYFVKLSKEKLNKTPTTDQKVWGSTPYESTMQRQPLSEHHASWVAVVFTGTPDLKKLSLQGDICFDIIFWKEIMKKGFRGFCYFVLEF